MCFDLLESFLTLLLELCCSKFLIGANHSVLSFLTSEASTLLPWNKQKWCVPWKETGDKTRSCWYFEMSEYVNSWNYTCYLKAFVWCSLSSGHIDFSTEWRLIHSCVLSPDSWHIFCLFCLFCPCSGLGCSWGRNNLFCRDGRQTWVSNCYSGLKTPQAET